MKKYIKIEKINIPKPNNPIKGSYLTDKASGISSDTIKKTIQEYDTYLQKVSY